MSRKTKRKESNADAATESGSTGGRGSSKILVAGVALVLLAVAGAGLLLSRTAERSPEAPARAEDPLASEHSPWLGNPDARVHIVEFLDPACETCAIFYPAVKQLMAQHPGRLRVSLRHVPFHAGAEFAVRLLEASRNQDKYWQTLEALLASQARWAPNHTVQPPLVMQAISGVGLDLEKLRADMDSPEVIQRMQKDMRDAAAARVRATPEFFVNGRPLPSFGWEQLQSLVADEVRKNY
jgi:protein-disulfide isomerase